MILDKLGLLVSPERAKEFPCLAEYSAAQINEMDAESIAFGMKLARDAFKVLCVMAAEITDESSAKTLSVISDNLDDFPILK